jgi:hypothetical protein
LFAQSTLLSGGQWPGMNYEDCSVIVDQKTDLDRPVAAAAANHIEAVVTNGPRRSGMPDNRFDFFDRDPMLCGVVEIPGNPSKSGATCHYFIME